MSMSANPPSLAKEHEKPAKLFRFLTKRVSTKHIPSSSPGEGSSRTILIKPQGRRSEENGATPSSRPIDNAGEWNGTGSRSSEEHTAIGAVPAAITHHEDAALGARSQVPANLDKIDELDESAVFGARLHHDGPYEATKRAFTEAGFTSKSRMPLGLDYGRLYQYHERTMKAVGHVYMPPEVPPGVPLNLQPGQLLPRNFRRQAGKPPRLRNNMVSPLPVENEADEALSRTNLPPYVVPPRHANLHEIPFHKGQGGAAKRPRPPRQLLRDNPLDGPPIDTSAIGLAMLTFIEDDDTPLPSAVAQQGHEDDTPLPSATALQGHERMDDEDYNPYAPENIGEPRPSVNPNPPIPMDRIQSPPPAYTESEPQSDTVSVMEFPTQCRVGGDDSTGADIHRSCSPSASPHMDFAVRNFNGASEETLVQKEDGEGVGQPPVSEDPCPFVHQGEGHEAKVEVTLLEDTGEIAMRNDFLKDEPVEPDRAVELVELNEMDPTPQQSSVTASNQPHSLEAQAVLIPQPMQPARYDKQLPPHPPSSPPPPDPQDNASPLPLRAIPEPTLNHPPPIVLPPPDNGREWKGPAQDDDLPRSAWSTTASQQSHCSTRVNDGHTPVPDTMSTASSSKLAPPGMMSRPSPATKQGTLVSPSTSLISRRDPVFNADSLTRYPPAKPSLVSGTSTFSTAGSSQDKKLYVIPAQRSRRNSTASSSAHSSILHTIHEEDSAPPPVPTLQRSQSSIQRREMLARIQVGQVYPKYLQAHGSTMEHSTQLTPQYQPPAYTEDPQPSRLPPREHRRREHKQASADPERYITATPSLEIHVTNSGYDPRIPPQETNQRDRPQSRSSQSTQSSSSRSTHSSSRSGHSSSSSAHTTPDQDPRVAATGDQRTQYAAYPFVDGNDAGEKHGQAQQHASVQQVPRDSAPRPIMADRRAVRAVNALSGVPEMEEGRSGSHHRQSSQFRADQPKHGDRLQHGQAYPQQQGHQHIEQFPAQQYPQQPNHLSEQRSLQQSSQHYHQVAKQDSQPLYQAMQVDGAQEVRQRPPVHFAEPSTKSLRDSHLLQPQPQPQQYPIQDYSSSKPRSMHSSLTASSTMPRFNPHLPKKLVMPAPLQGQITKSERVFNEVFDVPRPAPTPRSRRRDRASMTAMPRPGVQATPIRSREPTPGNIVPPLLGNGQELDPSSSAGRKLKKRSPPPPTRPSPSKAMDFAHPTISVAASEKTPPYSSKPSAVAKKVLSKRRTNV